MQRKHHSAKQVFLNTFAGLASNGGSALVGLIVTPLLIAKLGVEQFGFWAVVTAMVNYAGLLDGGLNSTFMKYVAEYAARNEPARIRQVTTFGTAFYVVLGLLVAPIAAVVSPYAIGLMHLDPALARRGPLIFGYVVLALFLTSAAGAIASVLSGFGKLRTVWTSNFLSRTVFSIVALIACTLGFGLDGMVFATFAQLAVFAIVTYVAARRMFGPLFCPPWQWERSVIVSLFKLGGWVQVTNTCSTIVVESNRFIISAFVSTSVVTYFEVASRLTRAARSLPFNFIVALLPAVSARNASLPDDRFNETYVRASRYVNFATLFLVGFIIAAGTPISYLWIGTVYPGIGVICAYVGLSFIFINATMVGTTMLRAVALARYEAYYYMVWTVASIALMIATVPFFGLMGVLAGMTGGAAIGTVYFLRVLHRLRGLDVRSGLLSWALPLCGIAAASIAGTAFAAARLAPYFHGRLQCALEVLILGTLYVVLFAAGTFAARFFGAEDWEIARRVLPGAIAPFRRRQGVSAGSERVLIR